MFFVIQLEEHFSRPLKEFVSLCLKKNPTEVASMNFYPYTTFICLLVVLVKLPYPVKYSSSVFYS